MATLSQTLAVNSAASINLAKISRPSQQNVFGANLKLSSRKVSFRSVAVSASATVDVEKLVAEIKVLTLEQARILTDRLQEELGVSAAAMMPMGGVAAPGAGGAEAAPVVEEKTEFDLFVDEVPSSARIAAIKIVRALTGLGLKEAKDAIEGLPKKIKEAVTKEEAEEAKKQLEDIGAKCSIK